MSEDVNVIPMGEHFTLKQLVDKLEELGLNDLFSPRGAPLTSTCCSGRTGIGIHHDDGWFEKDVSIIYFDEYDWVSNSINNVEYTIFDFYHNCVYNLVGHPDYVCVDEKTLATKIVLVHTDSHTYAYIA